MPDFIRCHRWPILTFLICLLLGFLARQSIGSIYGTTEAIALLDALSRAGLYLASAVMTASATTMALMLTLIGMIKRMDERFDRQAYRNIDLIARLTTASLLLSLLLLMAFVFPVGEFEEMPPRWFDRLYELLFAGTTLMIALAAATVVLIYTTLVRVISTVTPSDDI